MTETKDIELTEDQYNELFEAIEANTFDFTVLKLVEELAELQEKLIKFHLKSPAHKPKLKEILDEIGDVEIRIAMFLDKVENDNYDVDEYIQERISKKMMKLHGYFKEGKYKGGL